MYNMGQSISTCFNKFFKRIIIYPYLWINVVNTSRKFGSSCKHKRETQFAKEAVSFYIDDDVCALRWLDGDREPITFKKTANKTIPPIRACNSLSLSLNPSFSLDIH